jgi:hypothetical protein
LALPPSASARRQDVRPRTIAGPKPKLRRVSTSCLGTPTESRLTATPHGPPPRAPTPIGCRLLKSGASIRRPPPEALWYRTLVPHFGTALWYRTLVPHFRARSGRPPLSCTCSRGSKQQRGEIIVARRSHCNIRAHSPREHAGRNRAAINRTSTQLHSGPAPPRAIIVLLPDPPCLPTRP